MDFSIPAGSGHQRRRIIVGVLALLAAAQLPAAWALDPSLAVTQYALRGWQAGEAEGALPQNSVFCIVQTRDGYVWLATQEGLARFDGARFAVFNSKNTPGIRHNDIWRLLEDHEGGLWIGTRGGGLTRYKDGAFTHFGKEEGLPDDSVQALWEDRAGTLWIGTQGSGLVRYAGGKFSALMAKDGLAGDTVYAIAGDREGAIWIGTDGAGLSRYRDGKFATFNTGNGLSHNTVYAIHQDRDGDLWIGTGGGLNRMHDGKLTAYRVADGLSNDNVRALVEDRDGNLWIGTDGGGLDRYKNGRFGALTSKDGLSNDSVGALYEDREGSLWIGTDAGGINRLKDSKFVSYTAREGLSDDNARAILEDRDGGVWVGTFGGLNRFKDGKWTAYTTQQGLSKNVVLSLLQDKDGDLWAGTLGGGVNRLHDGKITTYGTRDGLSNDTVLAMLQDKAGRLWLGTRSGGLNVYENGKFRAFTTKDGLSSNDVRVLLEGADGSLWIGTRGGGLNRFKDNAFTSFTSKQGLSNDLVLALHEDAEGVLWIGTFGGGLNRFKDGRFTAVTAREGLPDDVVFQILEDAGGNLWMSSNHGIFKASRKELNAFADGQTMKLDAVAYGAADGMKSAEANGAHQPAGWKARDGRLWFPTIRGVATIDPQHIRANPLRPPVVIEQALVDEAPVSTSGDIAVEPGHKKLEFRYTALSYLAPERVQFSYRLEGFDEKWVPAGTRRSAQYTNLPPGRYRFHVIASNNDGLWNETGAELALDLQPFFYQRPAFFAAVGLALLLAAAGALRFHRERVRALQARAQELLRLVRDRQQAEHALREANAKLEQRLGELSHEGTTAREAVPSGEDMGRLVGQFNAQLEQLASLERELERARDALSREVREKTLANMELGQTLKRLTETQAQLVQSEKLASLGGLVAGIAHEINTPVGVSVTAASALEQAADRIHQQHTGGGLTRGQLETFVSVARDSSQMLMRNLQRAADLIHSFKQVAVDQASGERRRFRVAQYLDEILTSLAPTLNRTPHKITVACAEALDIDSYPGALAQIVTNLVNNSLMHAFPDGRAGHIHIGARRDGDHLVLQYTDDGIGIPPDNLRRIYDPFFTTRRGSGGSGLGLHIVYNLVTQRLGGTIQAASPPGRGAEFEIVFPVEMKAAA